MKNTNKYIVYTDGSFQSSLNAGGYSAIIINNDRIIKKLYQGYKNTTNNRMELMGILSALKYFKNKEPCAQIEIYSDSQYVVNNINAKNVQRWFDNNDYSKKNLDLWHEIVDLIEQLNVTFHWVKGHNDSYYNELADLYCTHAAQCLNIKTDLND